MSDAATPETPPILVAVDFSPASEAALAWAAAEARVHGCPLVVVHVVHEPEDDPGWYRRLGAGDDEDVSTMPLDVAAQRAFDAFVERCGREMRDLRALGDVDARLVNGTPTTRILELAASCGARHLVLGTRGRTGFKHLIGGSTAGRLIQLAPLPVTVVKAAPSKKDAEDAEA